MFKNNKDGIVKGAFSLAIASFISKILGAIYRIPLTNIVGLTGLGLYQMVFPIYALLLDFSGGGVPSALSKIISSQNQTEKEKTAHDFLRTSWKMFAFIGLAFSIFLCIFSKKIASLQGNLDAYLAYVFLSPAVFFVCVLSCFRGYFQGLMIMTPTALSQIIEQIIKLILGVLFAWLLISQTPKAVAGATFAITISEVVATFFMFLIYHRRKRKFNLNFVYNKKEFKSQAKILIKYCIPIVLVGILIPLSHVVDSFVTVNILSSYTLNATALFGIMSGVVLTIVNLPVSICYGIATVAIPSVSSALEVEQQNTRTEKLLTLTFVVSVVFAFVCFIFAPNAINILYRSLTDADKRLAVNLIRLTCPCIVLMSLLQTENAILIGKNKLYLPSLILFLGVLIKTILGITLLKMPQFNIYGQAIALNACYFFVCLVNLFMIFGLKVKNERKALANRQYAN